MSEYDLLFKLVIIGNSGVGKSSIINQYVTNFFSESYISTIGVDFMTKDIVISSGQSSCPLVAEKTAERSCTQRQPDLTFISAGTPQRGNAGGYEHRSKINKKVSKSIDQSSVQQSDYKRLRLHIWDTAGQERFRTITTSYYRNIDGVLLVYDITDIDTFNDVKTWINDIHRYTRAGTPVLILANKIDLKSLRVVSEYEGIEIAKNYKCSYCEVSAKDHNSIETGINSLVPSLLINEPVNTALKNTTIRLNEDKKKSKECC